MERNRLPQITIPKPCHEDWSKMTPDQRGAFCSVCNKSVWDFTNKSPDEVITILMQEQSDNMCGRFRTDQLAEPVKVEVPFYLLQDARLPRLTRFALTAFVIFGSALFSITGAYAQGGYSVKLPPFPEKQVIEWTPTLSEDTTVMPKITTKDSVITLVAGRIKTSSLSETINEIDVIPPSVDTTLPQVMPDSIFQTFGMVVGGIGGSPADWRRERRQYRRFMRRQPKDITSPVIDESVMKEENHSTDQPANTLVIGLVEQPLAANEALLSLFPNPTDGVLNLQYTIPAKTKLNIEIYDLQGKMQRSLVSGHVDAGSYTRSFDIATLPPGAYFCVMKGEGIRQTVKFVKGSE